MDWPRTLLVGAVTTLIVLLLGARQRTARPMQKGWRSIRIGALYHVGLWLGGGLWLLFAYVRFFVGSTRADAETQMMWLNLLLVAFAIMWIGTVAGALRVRTTAIRWRGRKIRFTAKSLEYERGFDEIEAIVPGLVGRTRIQFRDGAFLLLDPHAQGAGQLMDMIGRVRPELFESQTGEEA